MGKKMKPLKYISICLFLAVLLSTTLHFVSADLGVSKINDCVNIQVLANCSSSINLIQVSTKNQTFVLNEPMDNIGGQTYNYTFCNTSIQGIYRYTWDNPCVDCSKGDCGNSFQVTYTGDTLTSAKAVSYILIFIMGLIIFGGLLYLGIGLPSGNKRDDFTGYVIAVSNLKYLKLVMLGFAYLVALVIAYFSYIVCYSYLDMTFLTDLFYALFMVELIALFPLFILFIYLIASNWIKDTKIADTLLRGLPVK